MPKVKRLSLSFSSISNWQRCPRQWRNKYLLGLDTKESSPAMSFGSVLHEAFSALHEVSSASRPSSSASVLEHELEFLATSGGVPDPQAASAELQGMSAIQQHGTGVLDKQRLSEPYGFERYDLDHAFRLFAEYCKRYQNDRFIGTGTERKFELRLTPQIFIRGVIDGIGIYEGRPTIIEHKTTTNLWKFKDRAHASMQTDGYVWAAKQLGLDIEQVLYNGISTYWPGWKSYKGQRRMDAISTFFEEKAFLRTLVGVLPWRVDEFERTAIKIGNDIINHIENDLEFVKHKPESCFAFGKDCPFLEACNNEPSTEKILLDSEFESKPWSGLEIL